MAIDFARKAYSGRTPAIWRGECKILPGGFKPKNTLSKGAVVPRGVLLEVDMDTMEAAVVKTAVVLDGGTTTKIRVAKGSLFAVGDTVMKVGTDNVSPTVTAVDTSNVAYDVITVSNAITGIAKDDVISEATAYAPTGGGDGEDPIPAAPKYTPNACVGADLEVKDKIDTLDAAYDALILKNAVPYAILPEWIDGGMCLKGNHSIKFIKQ